MIAEGYILTRSRSSCKRAFSGINKSFKRNDSFTRRQMKSLPVFQVAFSFEVIQSPWDWRFLNKTNGLVSFRLSADIPVHKRVK